MQIGPGGADARRHVNRFLNSVDDEDLAKSCLPQGLAHIDG